jgi:septum formation protein
MSETRVVLASGSAVRRQMLSSAGLTIVTDAADIDESPLAHEEERARAARLALEKARAVSRRHPGALVIGSDQVGVLDDGSALDKVWSEAEARAQFARMRARTHTLVSAAALVKDGACLAAMTEEAHVTLRALSDDEIAAHVAHGEWKGSCGGYQIEHRGITLVERYEGSYHAILGLPLVSLLAALRAHGVH